MGRCQGNFKFELKVGLYHTEKRMKQYCELLRQQGNPLADCGEQFVQCRREKILNVMENYAGLRDGTTESPAQSTAPEMEAPESTTVAPDSTPDGTTESPAQSTAPEAYS